MKRKPINLYYYCSCCNFEWQDNYEEKYGECDDECEHCGNVYSPFVNQNDRKIFKKNEQDKKQKVS